MPIILFITILILYVLGSCNKSEITRESKMDNIRNQMVSEEGELYSCLALLNKTNTSISDIKSGNFSKQTYSDFKAKGFSDKETSNIVNLLSQTGIVIESDLQRLLLDKCREYSKNVEILKKS